MARQYMTKEVTRTLINSGKIIINPEGEPIIKVNKGFEVIGTISKEKAQKLVNKQYGIGSTIYSMNEIKETYRMRVEEFIKVAELVTDDTPTEDIEDGREEDEDAETNNMEEDQNQLPDQETRETTPKENKEGRTRITIIPKEGIEA